MDHKENQTWIKSKEGNFIEASKITHIKNVPGKGVEVYSVSGQWVGTFSSAKDFFAALQNGTDPEDVDG